MVDGIGLPKRLTAALLRELRLMVKEQVLSARAVRSILGVEERPLIAGEAGGYLSREEGERLFAAVRAKIEEQRAAQAERDRLQPRLPFEAPR